MVLVVGDGAAGCVAVVIVGVRGAAEEHVPDVVVALFHQAKGAALSVVLAAAVRERLRRKFLCGVGLVALRPARHPQHHCSQDGKQLKSQFWHIFIFHPWQFCQYFFIR
jgi:hypothetical protein